MNRWTKIAVALVAATAAVSVGLSSASAATGVLDRPAVTASPGLPAPAGPGHDAKSLINATYRPAKSETLFYPVQPCRILDTRHGGGIMVNNVARSFFVTGTTGFVGQGGTGGGCGIPSGATGVTGNVTTTAATGNGYMIGYPNGTAEPLTTFTSYRTGMNVTANPTFALGAGASKPLNIRAHGGNVQMVMDVTGYYIPQIAGLVSESGTIYAGSTRLLGATKVSTGQYLVTVDSDVSNCTPVVTPYYGIGVYSSAYSLNANTVRVYLWTISGGNPTPSDENGYFYLTVTC